MESLKPNAKRSIIAISLVCTVMIMEVIMLISDYFQYELLQRATSGLGISAEEANVNDSRQQILAIIYLVIYITSAFTFILWFRRAYFNLHTKVEYLDHPEGWAAGSWFVPIVNLYRPYQIMRELYQKTNILLIDKAQNYSQHIKTTLLGLWWTLWLIANLLGQIYFRMKKDTLDELVISTQVSIASEIIGILLALITVKVIIDYSKFEYLLYELEDEQIPNIPAIE